MKRVNIKDISEIIIGVYPSYKLIENIEKDIKIIGKVNHLQIEYVYNELDLSELNCISLTYENQYNDSIKNHKLPNTLLRLYCDNNHLLYLPKLPNNLNILYCRNNKLRELPILPESLYSLCCNNNPLIYLPKLPNNLCLYFKGEIDYIEYNNKTKLNSFCDYFIQIGDYIINDQESYNKYMKLLNYTRIKSARN